MLIYTAYQCAKGCDSEPTCEALVMKLADITCARKSYACFENETNSNAGRVFYAKRQIGKFSKQDKKNLSIILVKNLSRGN